MKFVEYPKLFINEYYENKINRIDLNYESLILKIENKTKTEFPDALKETLTELRMNLIGKIKSVKETILKRYDDLVTESPAEFSQHSLENNTKQIKDKIFLDQYCLVLNIAESYPLFEFKLGVLLFSEFEDNLFVNLK